jgi:polysaccharide biosynthesis protein PslG
MPASRPGRFVGLLGIALLALAIVIALLLGPVTGRAQARFAVGLQDDGFGPDASNAQAATAYSAMRAVHGSYVRIPLEWAQIVSSPNASAPPKGFDQSNPRDSNYSWHHVDAWVRAAAAHHLTPIMVLDRAPQWAEGPGPITTPISDGAWDPNPRMFAQFVKAVASRYSGHFPDPQNPGSSLPRVKYWEPWNEPNIPGFFSAPNQVSAYRAILNGAYASLKSVHSDNVVFIGGLSSVSSVRGSTPLLTFLADLLCVRRSGSRYVTIGSCRRVHFDAISVHPYALAATPTKHAYKPGDLLVGDIGKVPPLIRATGRNYPLWVTEFSWFTNPPNGQVGDSFATSARYVDWSMYEMWKAGVSVVIWFQVLDDNSSGDTFSGGGLYSAPGQPKPTLNAFGFPFVAGVAGGGWAWGRVPQSGTKTVFVERQAGSRWVRVATVRTGSDGVFTARFAARGNGTYRARVSGGPTSLSYNSRPIPPRRTHLFNP